MAQRTIALLPFLSAMAAAQTSVFSAPLPGFDSQSIVASVISVEPSATAYLIQCPAGTDSTDCGLGPGLTLKFGPSTLELHMTASPAETADVTCQIASNTATCTEELSGIDVTAKSIHASATVEVVTDLSSYYQPITITAGLEKLSGGAGAQQTSTGTSGGGSGGSSSTAGAGAGSSQTTPAPSGSGSGSGSSSTSSTTSVSKNAAMPMITQNAVLAGAAVVAAMVL